jgi:hypothetical protein
MKRRKVAGRKQPVLGQNFQGVDVRDIQVVSEIFQGLEFYVIHGDTTNSKNQLEALIIQNGGSAVQNPTEDTSCIITGKLDLLKVQVQKSSGKYDIVKPQWIYESISSGHCLPLEPKYIELATDDTKKQIAEKMDQYGDKYLGTTTQAELIEVVNNIKVEPLDLNDANELTRVIDERYFSDILKDRPFHGKRIKALNLQGDNKIENFKFRRILSEIKNGGGIITDSQLDCDYLVDFKVTSVPQKIPRIENS